MQFATATQDPPLDTVLPGHEIHSVTAGPEHVPHDESQGARTSPLAVDNVNMPGEQPPTQEQFSSTIEFGHSVHIAPEPVHSAQLLSVQLRQDVAVVLWHQASRYVPVAHVSH